MLKMASPKPFGQFCCVGGQVHQWIVRIRPLALEHFLKKIKYQNEGREEELGREGQKNRKKKTTNERTNKQTKTKAKK